MRNTISILMATGVLLCAPPMQAHHAQEPFYDQSRFVEISGVVTRFEFVNPHPHLFVEVTDDAGNKVEWALQFRNRTNMIKRGWSIETARPGDRLTATGHPSIAAGTYGMQVETIIRDDGTVLIETF
jgi:hypothetical protein